MSNCPIEDLIKIQTKPLEKISITNSVHEVKVLEWSNTNIKQMLPSSDDLDTWIEY